MFNVVENRRWYYIASGILIALSIAALIVPTIQLGRPLPLTAETARTAGLAILAAAAIVSIFVAWSFRDLSNALRYGVCTLAILAHNMLIVCGFYALMGMLAQWEASDQLLAAALAVTVFSAQDAISLFGRIREPSATRRTESYEAAINRSILGTVNRTLATRLCVAFILIAILLFGGAIIKPFAATTLVGMIAEVYAVNLVATSLLITWEKWAIHRAVARAEA
jgi:preprotein translocase subunit SecF